MNAPRKRIQQRSRFAVGALTALLSIWTPIAAIAQDGVVARQQSAQGGAQQASQAAQNPITQPLTLSPEVTRQRVGVTEGDIQPLSVQDAIRLSLQNNLDIEQFRQGVAISERSLYSLRGLYDIVSTADVNFRSQTVPVANAFGGGGTSASFTSRSMTWNFGTSQAVERTGGFWTAEFDNTRTRTSATNATITPQFNSLLNFTFTQPLMRNFKIDSNRRQIQVAKKSLDISDSLFRQRVIEIINSVQRAYWDLVFARKNESISRDSVELARTQLENNRKMVEAGTLAPIELRSTEAQLETAKGNVIVALQGVTTAENALKGLLLKDPNDKMWSAELNPTDQPVSAEVTYNLGEAIGLALKNRPELDQLRLQTEQKNIDLSFYKNQLKPQVDFFGIYGNSGLAGTPVPVIGIPVTLPERFSGAYGQALNNLFSQDFKTYQFGVRLSVPWRNRTAEGNYGRTLAEARQLDARQRQVVQNVQIDVRNALQAVVASKQRYEAAQAGELAAQAQYSGEQERYRAGLSTNFVVLQRQTDLSVARGTTVRALTDYNKALADLQRVTGMTLMSNNVNISSKPTDAQK